MSGASVVLTPEAKELLLTGEDFEDWNEVKKWSSRKVRRELKRLGAGDFDYKTTPYDHQYRAMIPCLTFFGFNLWLDMGTGKTKVILDVFAILRQLGEVGRLLVACPKNCLGEWASMIEEHSYLSYSIYSGNVEKRWERIQEIQTDIALINYDGLRIMLTKRVKVKKAIKTKLDPKRIKTIGEIFDVLAWDEYHQLNNKGAWISKLAMSLSGKMKHRFGLSGTPFGANLLDLWNPYTVIDRGETFSDRLVWFRKAYFVDKGYWGPKWKVTKAGKKKLQARIYNRAISYKEEECNELPPKMYHRIELELEGEQLEYYLKYLESEKKSEFDVKNKFMKFRQISDGIIKVEEGVWKDLQPQIKLTKLQDILEGYLGRTKVVVFHQFIHTAGVIADLVNSMGYGVAALNSTVKNNEEEIRAFKEDDDVKVFTINPQSGGVGLNLPMASVAVFYSPIGSIKLRPQAEKRVHRTGQTKRTHFYDLIMADSVDFFVDSYYKEGLDLKTELMKGKVGLNDVLRGIKTIPF